MFALTLKQIIGQKLYDSNEIALLIDVCIMSLNMLWNSSSAFIWFCRYGFEPQRKEKGIKTLVKYLVFLIFLLNQNRNITNVTESNHFLVFHVSLALGVRLATVWKGIPVLTRLPSQPTHCNTMALLMKWCAIIATLDCR